MVVGYRTPQGFNPINSVRIADLGDKIPACSTVDCLAEDKFPDGKGPPNTKATEVKTAMLALDELDGKTVVSNVALNALALINLAGKLREEYLAIR